ncbi:MAG: hypothetical protein K0S45_1888 [Nitrospira sp.]|jgi:hypothetical protein|nr:hypothetical protein [Nitrospira sp.]
MAQYDLDLFQVHHRWHYRILKMGAEARLHPTVAYDSRTGEGEGYASQSEARHIALAHKAKLVALWVPGRTGPV